MSTFKKKVVAGLTALALLCSTSTVCADDYSYCCGRGYQECCQTPCLAPGIALGAIALAAIIAVAVQNSSNKHSHCHAHN